MSEETPITVLQKQIDFFKKFQKRIETGEGLRFPDDPEKRKEVEGNLSRKHTELTNKIYEFEQAIAAIQRPPKFVGIACYDNQGRYTHTIKPGHG